jgi:hypothetical protein
MKTIGTKTGYRFFGYNFTKKKKKGLAVQEARDETWMS